MSNMESFEPLSPTTPKIELSTEELWKSWKDGEWLPVELLLNN